MSLGLPLQEEQEQAEEQAVTKGCQVHCLRRLSQCLALLLLRRSFSSSLCPLFSSLLLAACFICPILLSAGTIPSSLPVCGTLSHPLCVCPASCRDAPRAVTFSFSCSAALSTPFLSVSLSHMSL